MEVKSPTIAAYGRYSADNSEYQNGYDMASQALDEHTSSTAFVGNNDMTAFGIMAAISDHGFRVPHDYSVCGFDNIPLSSMPQIALTTIEHASLAKVVKLWILYIRRTRMKKYLCQTSLYYANGI